MRWAIHFSVFQQRYVLRESYVWQPRKLMLPIFDTGVTPPAGFPYAFAVVAG